MTGHLFAIAADAAIYATAGNATLTLSSRRTGARFTYRVRLPDDGDGSFRFVSLLTGPDNTADYAYLGLLRGDALVRTRRSRIGEDAPSFRAFAYFARHVIGRGVLPPELEVRHEGRCGRCARPLTVPESIDRGLGPECAGRMAA